MQNDKLNSDMYSYPNMMYIPSNNCSKPKHCDATNVFSIICKYKRVTL
jgi:hypothetical protein